MQSIQTVERPLAGTPVSVSDDQWAAIRALANRWVPLRAGRDEIDRRFVEAALSVMVGDCHWVLLAEERFGNWRVNWARNARWVELGVWSRVAAGGALNEDTARRVLDYVERHRRKKRRRAARRVEWILHEDR